MQPIHKLLEFYSGKRVLITGDTGFKGSWLGIWLKQLGAEVIGYSLPPTSSETHFELAEVERIITHIDGDIRDADNFIKRTQEFQPDILFHLAAQPIVKRSYDEPKLTFDTNVGGSVNVLEAVRLTSSLRSVVYITSDKCYMNKEWVWGYRENDELGGHDPYSGSKAAAELAFYSYWKSFFEPRQKLGIASARAGNVIGGGDWALNRIIPDCIRALKDNQKIIIRNPNATRPWQHVLEPLWGYLLLGIRLWEYPKRYSGSWNFGPKSGAILPVIELVKKVIKYWGGGNYSVETEDHAPHENQLLKLNSDKANILLHWETNWDLEHTIERSVEWYTRVNKREKAIVVTREQIAEYGENAYPK